MSNPFVPYAPAGDSPPLPPFEGHSVVVHVVLNVETWPFDQPMPRKLIPAPHGAESVPDVLNFSWVEYGMRVGLPRLLAALTERRLPVSVSMNAAVADVYPRAVELLAATGWEFVGHGTTQRSLHRVEDERAEIAATLDRIERATGTRPRGWLGPGLQETWTTLASLAELGVDYVCDWSVDDVPVWARAGGSSLVAVPYNLELNDSVLFAVERASAAEFEARARATLPVLLAEAERWGTRVLALPLHPHLLGVPHRIGALTRVLDHFAAHEQVTFQTSGAVADWFAATVPAPANPSD
ncbi:polysaccharide deacetylase family protein [Streptomyces sp. 4N509B]|uniref:polysaccharide deacetylase family protein n=1 Tax=Streptomyces sp. 4N509B TaxID=3457413 RepID=UPI003FCF8B0A